jgi:predicted nucleic acid-binding protein
MRFIVDTCVWSHFLRSNRDASDPIAAEVARLARADAVQMLGPIRHELLSGARPSGRFEQLKEYLRFYSNLPLDEEDDENAANYYNLCRNHGIQGTATDLLICAVAVRYGLRIFTTDSDFDSYALHLPIALHQFRRRRWSNA